MIERFVVGTDILTVSLLVWRRFLRPMPGLVERVLDTNPGLADLGPILPLGTVVDIPIDAPRSPELLPPVKLWPA